MESLKRIIYAFLYFGFIFTGVIFLAQYDRTLALIFNMACLGALCSYLASKKQRNVIGWFFLGFFTGVLGLAFAIGIKPKELASE